jgi:hypothetical protein
MVTLRSSRDRSSPGTDERLRTRNDPGTLCT